MCPWSEDFIASQLVRRQRGYGRGGRMQIEQDYAHIISGVRHGLTLGSPIGMTMGKPGLGQLDRHHECLAH